MHESSGRRQTLSLAGKVVVVTGAARGIGRAAAIALADAGADIVGVDIAGHASAILDYAAASADDLAETGRLVEASGRRWQAFAVDQRDLPALREVAAKAESEMGGLDALFANAGIQAFKPILEMEDADWHDQIDINLTGTMNALRAFAPAVKRRAAETGHGRIIMTASTQGQHGAKYGAAYSASKWGIIGLMKSAALEFGEFGITVNALVPGLIDTPLTRHPTRYEQALEEGGKTPSGDPAKDEAEARKVLIAKTPLGLPWLEPEDIAPMVVFLASDAACMASGGTYPMTGGDSAHGMA